MLAENSLQVSRYPKASCEAKARSGEERTSATAQKHDLKSRITIRAVPSQTQFVQAAERRENAAHGASRGTRNAQPTNEPRSGERTE
jgi:hypothetical protein